MKSYRPTAYLLLLIASIIWAIAGPVIKYVLGVVPPLPFLFLRFTLSSIVALISFAFTGFHPPKKLSTLVWLLFYGFITSTVTLGLLFVGLKGTTVLEMSLISLTGPLMIAVAGVVFLREHITQREKIGMAIALVGTVLTIITPLKLSGNLLIILYLIANTFSVIICKKLLRLGVSPSLMTNMTFIVGFATTLPLVIGQTNFGQLSLYPILGIAFLAVLSGNLAYYLGNRAQKSIEISEAGLFSYLYPLLSMPLAVIWLHEEVTLPYIIGAIVVVIGVVIAEIKN
ncbi:MAG: DMT family transporter [Candidatus Microgenomates bacterium]|jgi:drug/metabolite transporter (DMT)-like permease